MHKQSNENDKTTTLSNNIKSTHIIVDRIIHAQQKNKIGKQRCKKDYVK
ncbi:hypothetical protein RT0751 [Rickettsia typhi str. Wilmington]|uniref:Uncharacterized protein n=2 Tax=Rickettsia typhi TaxID=785 RepID=Q68VY4_RICTY|nr:hypothetical protein RT0751 [Rickettsia typhi str. Wilmington]AFE54588.1 hypothetical protein RTTH1527_03615 [Rickettsia typhi str. TH1527]AFE55426.1 hypothetical protein RTB9991CWPP_03615 [Rickettsia typhi str. B9991CWPP]